MLKKICNVCTLEYNTYRMASKYCSRTCSTLGQRKRTITLCVVCSSEIEQCASRSRICCSYECAKKHFSIKFKGDGNPNYDNHVLLGKTQSKDICRKKKIAVKKSWENPDRMRKHIAAREKYKNVHGFYPINSPQSIEKSSISSALRAQSSELGGGYRNYIRGKYTSRKSSVDEFYQSSFELERMQQLDSDDTVLMWTKQHGIVIPYELNSKTRRYVPDFYITTTTNTILEEVKGWVADEQEMLAKTASLVNYCSINNHVPRVNFMKNRDKWERFALNA